MNHTALYFATALLTCNAFAQDPLKPHCGELNTLKVGDMAPVFEAVDLNGNAIDLTELLKSKQVVLAFYRGSWCPYCTKEMAALYENLSKIEALNGTVIAVSPEKAETASMIVEKTGATFPLLRDGSRSILCAFGVAYELEDQRKEKMRKMGLSDDGVLPVPATFVIGMDGRIKAIHFDTDYSKRMSVADVLTALEK